MKICTFFGHRDAPESIRSQIFFCLEDLIVEEKMDTFYLGNNGNFDRMVKAALLHLQKLYPHISCYIVLAYVPGEKGEFGIKEDMPTIFPDGLETVPRRFAISHRNKWMVNQAEYVVCYIERSWGGAVQFVKMAKRKGKKVINLNEDFGELT